MKKDTMLFVLALAILVAGGVYYFTFSPQQGSEDASWAPPATNPPTTQMGVSIQEPLQNSTP